MLNFLRERRLSIKIFNCWLVVGSCVWAAIISHFECCCSFGVVVTMRFRTGSARGSLPVLRYGRVKDAIPLKDPADGEGMLRSHTKHSHPMSDVYPPHWDLDGEKDAGR
jgi:hypothetical protein